MISLPTAKQLALSFPEAEEKSHFERPDFRVRNKVFASLHVDKNVMVIKLSLVDQSVFCAFDSTIIYPVPGGWGRRGWTMINLKKIKKAMLVDALTTAWKTVAPATLVKKYFPTTGS
jgi:hypothetical protein